MGSPKPSPMSTKLRIENIDLAVRSLPLLSDGVSPSSFVLIERSISICSSIMSLHYAGQRKLQSILVLNFPENLTKLVINPTQLLVRVNERININNSLTCNRFCYQPPRVTFV